MSSSMVTAIAGVVVAISALVTAIFSSRKTQAETDQIRRANSEIGSTAANAESMARLAYHETSPTRQSITLYDSSSGGFSLFDFQTDRYEGAAGELSLAKHEADDDTLVIVRGNTNGTLVFWLKRYGYRDGPTVIPVGDAAGVRRMFRVRCEVQAFEAEHTFLLMLKMVGEPAGRFLDQRRHRITPGAWTYIDDHLDASFSANCYLRLEDREVSAAPSRIEIRNLVVTESEPPLKLMPLAP